MKRALRRVTALPGLAAILGAAVAFFVPQLAFSQTDDAATLADFRACGALQRDSARLACFDAVLAADREGGDIDETAEPAPVTVTVAPVAPLAAAEPAETPVAPEPEPESEPAEAPAAATPQPEPAEAATESVAQTVPAEVAHANETPTAAVRPETAAATRAARAEGTEASAFTIVEMTTRIPGAARFITDDGRVFIQTSGGSNYRNFPDVPFPATLEDGALGSNFLRLGPRLRVRVRAVE